jgi:hypothetical protein
VTSGIGSAARAGWRARLSLRPLAVLIALVCSLATAGCGIGSVSVTPPPPAPVPIPRLIAAPTDCTLSPATSADVDRVLRNASPGQKICLLGRYSPDTELTLTRSGTSSEPIVVESNGAKISGVEIDADHVVVQGFNVWGAGGIVAQGQDIMIRNNDVRDAANDGVVCAPCSGAQIVANWVIRADGVGIVISGQNSGVYANEVSRSIRQTAPYADGIGFAGTDLTFQHNYVHDIDATGYPPDQAPHADCFRTTDSPGQAGSGVLLFDNVCANVSGHCLAADGSQRHGASVPDGEPGLRFMDNYCQNSAPQAVQLVAYPDVLVQGNTFSADYRTAVLAQQGSTGVTVTDNTLVGTFAAYQVDASSTAGLEHSDNVTR